MKEEKKHALCSKEWTIRPDEIIGRGGHRTVYRACRRETRDCDYVAKIGRIRTLEEWEEIKNEEFVSRKLYSLKGGPKLENLFYCDLDVKRIRESTFWRFVDSTSFETKDEKKFFSFVTKEPFWDNRCEQEACVFYVFINEYLEGLTARQWLKLRPGDKEIMQLKVLAFVLKMFENDLVVADPNFDNFVVKNNELFLIDAGAVYPVKSPLLKKFETFMKVSLHTARQVLENAEFVMRVV